MQTSGISIFTIGGIKSKRQVIKIKSVHPTYVGGQYIAELYLYNKLNDNHGLDESIWDEKKGVAYSGNLIAMVFSGSDAITTLAHELLHLHDFGNLRDVGVKNVLNNRPMRDYGGQSRKQRFLELDKPY